MAVLWRTSWLVPVLLVNLVEFSGTGSLSASMSFVSLGKSGAPEHACGRQ